MQTINISVLNTPARYLTTQSYPLYFVESLSTGLAVNDSASRLDPVLVSVKIPAVESIGAVMTLHDVVLSSPPKTKLTENLGAQLTVNDVVSRQLLKSSTQENIGISLSINNVVSRPLIKTNVDEVISVSLSINDVIREKI